MSDTWYIHRAGSQYGPYSEQAFRCFARDGHLQPDDLVWFEGAQNWMPGASFLSPTPSTPPDSLTPDPTSSCVPSSPRRRFLNAYAFLAILFLMAMGALAVLEPASIPYRLAGALNGAVFGGLAGGLAALVLFLVRKALSPLPIAVAAFAGFVFAQAAEYSINSVGSGIYEQAVKPRVTKHIIAQELDKHPVFRLLGEADAAAYQELRNEIAKRAAAGASGSEISAYSEAYVANFRRLNAHHVIIAPPEYLEDVVQSTYAITAYLQRRNVALCRAFVVEGFASSQMRTLSTDPQFSTLLMDNAKVLFAAIAAGKKSPASYSALGEADVELASQQLILKGWTDDMRLALAEPRRLQALPPEQACKVQLEWLEALSHLPVEPRARWHREILATAVQR
ncbi:MAG: DUF4339 domain-containing protein [Hyphomicrobium sp.]|nr:DUF4339 domain-containing protein [Hyphomicrobium sp.]